MLLLLCSQLLPLLSESSLMRSVLLFVDWCIIFRNCYGSVAIILMFFSYLDCNSKCGFSKRKQNEQEGSLMAWIYSSQVFYYYTLVSSLCGVVNAILLQLQVNMYVPNSHSFLVNDPLTVKEVQQQWTWSSCLVRNLV